MAINKHSEKTVVADSSRRSFLAKLWIGLGLLALLQTAGVVVAYLRPHGPKTKDDKLQSIVKAGPVESFPLDSVTAFIRGKFYLARFDDGGFLALSRKCTHLGCTVLWSSQDKKFVCPCHSSEFDIHGEVLDPPATRALDTFRISIENNVVKVDLGKRIKRSRFDRSHVAYPKGKYPA
jgi:Rieske Fe-S protein